MNDNPDPEGVPSWLALSTPDLARSTAFYAAVLGWSWKPFEDGTGHTAYLPNGQPIAAVTPSDGPGGRLWQIYFTVHDLASAASRVARHGGSVDDGAADPPGPARSFVAADPTGATFGVWQTGLKAFPSHSPGALAAVSLSTRDATAGDRFYRELFGYEQRDDVSGPAMSAWSLSDGRPIGSRVLMGPAHPAHVPAHWATYFAVTDLVAVTTRVTAEEGTVGLGPIDLPQGRIAIVMDPHDTPFGLIQTSDGTAG